MHDLTCIRRSARQPIVPPNRRRATSRRGQMGTYYMNLSPGTNPGGLIRLRILIEMMWPLSSAVDKQSVCRVHSTRSRCVCRVHSTRERCVCQVHSKSTAFVECTRHASCLLSALDKQCLCQVHSTCSVFVECTRQLVRVSSALDKAILAQARWRRSACICRVLCIQGRLLCRVLRQRFEYVFSLNIQ